MSQNEELRQAIDETVGQTVDAWRQHQASTIEWARYIQGRLKEADSTAAGFLTRFDEIVKEHYGKGVAGYIKTGSDAIGKAHNGLSQALEGATHPDAVNGLQKIGEARQASEDMLSDIGQTSEAISSDLAAKIEALRSAIHLARVQVFAPFIGAEAAAQLVEAEASNAGFESSPDPEVTRHFNIAVSEFELFMEGL